MPLNLVIDVSPALASKIDQLISLFTSIQKGVTNLSQQSTAALAALSAFQAQFATFSADATTTLKDIAARPAADPADSQALTAIATGLSTIGAGLAALDAQVKAADPGPVPTPSGPAPAPVVAP
jgi:uncharacterized phage infection (PIP) family protein YhgE